MWLESRHPGVYLDAIHKATLWVAEGDEIMGFVETDGIEVSKLFVAANHAFRGIGEELLQIALAHIGATGAPTAYLESPITAVKFYELNSFRVAGTGFFSRCNSSVQIEVIKMERNF
jgi:putative acetyltransferase